MYTAMIYVVLMTGQPVILQDTRGPYMAQKECVERVGQMKAYLNESMPSATVVDSRCKHEGTGA